MPSMQTVGFAPYRLRVGGFYENLLRFARASLKLMSIRALSFHSFSLSLACSCLRFRIFLLVPFQLARTLPARTYLSIGSPLRSGPIPVAAPLHRASACSDPMYAVWACLASEMIACLG
jgi:hypothetical protein